MTGERLGPFGTAVEVLRSAADALTVDLAVGPATGLIRRRRQDRPAGPRLSRLRARLEGGRR